ncbi:MAG: hypothetical protein JRF02_03235 [Deltaproteobacteria bacterium]|jgi:hypothetical protein|nr:hypothetical protein [Deltaproteobacteria bacterium]
MNIIESYGFGQMVIDGNTYTKDVIIYPDGSILSPWWRRQGHYLVVEDITELIATVPDIIICGTGAMGVMRISADLKKYLKNRRIELIAQKSSQAVATYNRMSGSSKIGGCFHLTC